MKKALTAAFVILFLVLAIQPTEASITSSPTSVSDNVASSSSESWNMGFTPDENIQNVSATIVGSNAENDAVLGAMLTLWPKYWATIDNAVTENATLTADTTGIAVGTYTGTIELVANENTLSIPLTFTVGAPVTPSTGLTPSRGRIVATMPTTSTLEKSIIITNLTGQSLTSIDAYMAETQLYGPAGTDWIIVQFEAPYSLAHGETFTVTADIQPQNVPNGEHIRTLTVEAWYGTTQVTANIIIRVTIYGAIVVVSETDIAFTKDGTAITEISAGNPLTFTLTPAVDAKIYAGGTLLGTANENGILTADAPSTSGTYTIEARADNGTTLGNASLDVSEVKDISIVLDQVQFNVGNPVTGTVYSNGEAVSGLTVRLSGQSVSTGLNGGFAISTLGMDGDSHNISVDSMASGLVRYREATSTVVLIGSVTPSWVWALSILAIMAVALGAFKFWKEGKLSWLEDTIRKYLPNAGKPKVPLD